jgi:hypothetical protein
MTDHQSQTVVAEQRYEFDTREEFLNRLEALAHAGVKWENVTTLTPFHIHEVEHIMKSPTSHLRFFTLVGAVSGFVLSFLFIIYTVLSWPLITGGKPLISVPAFIIVAFECTILIGGIVSFLGFLFISRLPNVKAIIHPRECGDLFVIIRREVVS